MSTDHDTPDTPPFWARQFAPRPTADQIVFDIAFGIALPLLCLYFDPFVFQSGLGRPLFGNHVLVGRVAVGLGLLSLSVWTILRWPPAALAGLLAGGAIFALLLGLVLLPMTIIGLLALIGVLGLTPFVTAFVFWRNAVRAFKKARRSNMAGRTLLSVVVGLTIACAGPWAAQWYVTREVSRGTDLVLSGDPSKVTHGAAVLKWFRLVSDFDQLALAYVNERDFDRREQIAAIYREVAGRDIEHQVRIILD